MSSDADAHKVGLIPVTLMVSGNIMGSGVFLLPANLAATGGIAIYGWLVTIIGALAKTGKYDAVIALGTVIRGGTAHFEYVAGGASNGLAHVAQDSEIPVAFGVLTTESIEQAIERAGTKAGNKGAEAALTALEMINVLKAIKA